MSKYRTGGHMQTEVVEGNLIVARVFNFGGELEDAQALARDIVDLLNAADAAGGADKLIAAAKLLGDVIGGGVDAGRVIQAYELAENMARLIPYEHTDADDPGDALDLLTTLIGDAQRIMGDTPAINPAITPVTAALRRVANTLDNPAVPPERKKQVFAEMLMAYVESLDELKHAFEGTNEAEG